MRNLGKNEKKVPRDPPTHKITKKSSVLAGWKRDGEPGRWESAVISRASLFGPSRALLKRSPLLSASHTCHAWICGQGTEPEEGTALSGAGKCMASGEGPVSLLVGRENLKAH